MTPLPIGIVGLNFGRHIIEELSQEENRAHFRIAAVCDMDAPKAEAMAQKLGVKAYTDLDALLADSEIPVVGLFTGPNGRAGLLRRIVRAGKDVMTTKPFENDADAAAEVLREAAELKRVIHLNSPAPNLAADQELIARWRTELDLGRPVGARAETWASYREKADGSWYDDPERCPVAPIFRLGIYLINDLIGLFGPAEQVQVMQSRIFTGRPTPDNAQLGILFKNGAVANIYASFCVEDAQHYRGSLILNFERGTIYRNVGPIDSPDAPPVAMEVATKDKAGNPLVLRESLSSRSGGYQWAAFHDAIQRREPTTAIFAQDLTEGLRIIAAMTRAQESGATEKVI